MNTCSKPLHACLQCGSNTQLLHVFQEDFILGYKPQKEQEAFTPAFSTGGGIYTITLNCASVFIYFFIFTLNLIIIG